MRRHIESWELEDQLLEIFKSNIDDLYSFGYNQAWLKNIETFADVLRVINEMDEAKLIYVPSGHTVFIYKPITDITGYDRGTVSILFATSHPWTDDVRYFLAETDYESFNIPYWRASSLDEVVIKRQTILEYKRY